MTLGSSPAAADTPPSNYRCSFHGNVGPIGSNFWIYENGYTGSTHVHVWRHYIRGSNGAYYYNHTSSVAGCPRH